MGKPPVEFYIELIFTIMQSEVYHDVPLCVRNMKSQRDPQMDGIFAELWPIEVLSVSPLGHFCLENHFLSCFRTYVATLHTYIYPYVVYDTG